MTITRELSGEPGGVGLMLRAAMPLVPGAAMLPFVAGGGHELPDLALGLSGARLDRDRLAEYLAVCGFAPADTLPATAPHLLAFPLHMALMTDGSFPFPAIGLVHVGNRIIVHRPLGVREPIDVRVVAAGLHRRPRGVTFTLVSEARVGSELVWEEHSTMLRREGGAAGDEAASQTSRASSETSERSGTRSAASRIPALAEAGRWRAEEGLGRRYGGVSGDRNPIHMHALSAKLFGFPRAIAHGMWTKARCLAALQSQLPDAYSVEVVFRKPIPLPGEVLFAQGADGDGARFAVRSADGREKIHLEGKVSV